ncbi:hypothetical protein FRC01_011490, partial [Tulasnella sp. 417]
CWRQCHGLSLGLSSAGRFYCLSSWRRSRSKQEGFLSTASPRLSSPSPNDSQRVSKSLPKLFK